MSFTVGEILVATGPYMAESQPASTAIAGAISPDVERVLNILRGDGDGILRTDTSPFFAVTASDPADMQVHVAQGFGFIDHRIISTSASEDITFVAPDEARTDLIQFTYGVGLNVKVSSIEADESSLAIASVDLTPLMTEITASEITDLRSWL